MNNENNKTYYLVAGDNTGNIDDEMFTNKAKAVKEAKARVKQGLRWDILIYKGCEDDKMANYIGQVTL